MFVFFGYLAGVLLHSLNEGFVLLFGCVFILISLFRLIIKRRASILMILCIFMAIGGYIRYNAFLNHGNMLDDYIDEYAYVTGTICDIPQKQDENFVYSVQTDTFKFNDRSLSYRCTMRFTSRTEYKFGDKIEFFGALNRFEKNTNGFAFDSEKYYNTKRIFYRMYDEYSIITDKKVHTGILRYNLNKMRNNIYKLISENETSEKYKSMSGKIFLNISSGFDKELKSVLQRGGTWRFLYSSRIHFVLIILFIGLFRKRIPKRHRDVFIIAAAAVYAMINADSGSGMRIMIFTVISVLYARFRGFHSFMQCLCSAITVIGIINPMMLFNEGFIISSLSCAAVHIIYPPLFQVFKRVIRNIRAASMASVFVVLAVVMAPVSAYLGFELSLFSIMLMPIFVILSGLCYVLFPLYILFGLMMHIGFFKMLIHAVYMCITGISYVTCKMPGVAVNAAKPSYIFLALWYTAVGAVLFKKIRGRLAAASAVFLTVLVCSQAVRLGNIEIHFVSVGQGDAAVVSLPYRVNIIVDGGGSEGFSDYNHGEFEFIPYLFANGLTNIDAAFVSHYHSDHALGVISAIEECRVKKLYLPYEDKSDEICSSLIRAASDNDTEIIYLMDGKYDLKNGLYADIKLLNDKSERDLNERCGVYKFIYGEFSALFTGDIGKKSERRLIDRGFDLSCDVLKVPHHGSAASSSLQLVKSANPKYAFAGIGFGNSYGFPANATLDTYRRANIPFYSTAVSGNIIVSADKKGKIKLLGN